jgi:hypothetical protein
MKTALIAMSNVFVAEPYEKAAFITHIFIIIVKITCKWPILK